MKRFYQWSPLTYRIAVEKGRLVRRMQDRFSGAVFASMRSDEKLPALWYQHKSLIRCSRRIRPSIWRCPRLR